MRYAYVKKEYKYKRPAVIIFSTLSLIIGTTTLLWAFFPIITYQFAHLFSFAEEISPLPRSVLASSLQKGLRVYDSENLPYYSSYLKDFTRVQEWFPKQPQLLTHKKKVKDYTIDVSKISVHGASVTIGGDDLATSLVQYGDQVVPGEIGNVVIVGHSTLPQLFKDKDYKSIFSYLPSIERGDKIQANVNGFTYTYDVYDMFVVEPEEVWVLDPKSDEATLTLISCVPPGTVWKRLVVKSRLSSL
ncbi:MAG: sortase [Patescibacteria group bacterium]|jgi:sortase A